MSVVIRKSCRVGDRVDVNNCFDRNCPVGTSGRISSYLFGAIFDEKNGLAVGCPRDQARVSRIAYKSSMRRFFIAFDLGLTKGTLKALSTASVERILFRTRHDAAVHGFRSVSDGYDEQHANCFVRCMPSERDRIGVAFADLLDAENNTTAGVSFNGFPIGFHEGSLNKVPFGDEQAIAFPVI